MAFADLQKIYLSLGSKSGESTEANCDLNNELDGSFFRDDFTLSEVDYVGATLREQNVYHIDSTSQSLVEFHKRFKTEMQRNNLALFKNFDIKNSLALLEATDRVALTLPVHIKDTSLDPNSFGMAKDVLNADDVIPILEAGGLLTSIENDPLQNSTNGTGYKWLNIMLENPPSPLQLKALYTIKSRLEELAESTDEKILVQYHGVDWATFHAIAETQLKQFADRFTPVVSQSGFTSTLHPNFIGKNGVPAERFDAYAQNTQIPTILGNNEYMRLLDWDNEPQSRFVQYKRLAQYAGMDGEDLSLAWQIYMGLDATDRSEFQKTLLHFKENIVNCHFSFQTSEGLMTVEAYYDPEANYLDLTVQRKGQLGRIESEWNKHVPHTYTDMKHSGELTINEQEIFLMLFQFRCHLLELNEQGLNHLTHFDDQILIGYKT